MNPIKTFLENGGIEKVKKAGRGAERLSVPSGVYIIAYLLWEKLEGFGIKLDALLAYLRMHHGGG